MIDLKDINSLGVIEIIKRTGKEIIYEFILKIIDLFNYEKSLRMYESANNQKMYNANEALLIQSTAYKWIWNNVELHCETNGSDDLSEHLNFYCTTKSGEPIDDYKSGLLSGIMENVSNRIKYYA